MAFLQRISSFTLSGMEEGFYRWGKFLTRHPGKIIILTSFLFALSGVGFINYRQEYEANHLWIPSNSSFNIHQKYLETNFREKLRHNVLIYKSDNILTPFHIQQMYELHKKILSINVRGKTFNTICKRRPVANILQIDKRRRRRRRRETSRTKVKAPQADLVETFDTVKETKTDDYVNNNSEIVDKPISTDDIGFWDTYDDYDYEDDVEDTDAGEEGSGRPRIDFDQFGPDSRIDDDRDLPADIYCGIVTTVKEKCVETNLLEIWKFEKDLIYSTTQEEIIDAVNLLRRSPWSSHEVDFVTQLGGVERNATGHVVSATAARMYWGIEVPKDAILVKDGLGGVDLNPGDQDSLDWEEEFINISLNTSVPGVTVYPSAAKSFGEINAETILFDTWRMVGGYSLMFVYTMLMLGRLNTMEVKLYLSVAGLVSVGMGLVAGIGLASLLGYAYTPIHSALPFLCLGIGIDDMFVIVQCWFNMKRSEGNNLPLDESVGITLKHAGVSVTITTLTDVFAFGVGAVTKIPGLESFCVCTAIALGSIYILQISFFTAFLYLDECRIRSGRDGLIPCYTHKVTRSTSSHSRPRYFNNFISIYKKLLSSVVYRVCVMVVTLTLFGFGIWGCTLIKQKFDPVLLLPDDSYLRKFLALNDQYYSSEVYEANVYTGSLDFRGLQGMETLVNDLDVMLQENKYIESHDSWWTELKKYAQNFKNYSTWEEFNNEEDFQLLLSDFLFSRDGSRFRVDFKFGEEELVCGKPAPRITSSRFPVRYLPLDDPEQHIPAKHSLEAVIANSRVSEVAFSHLPIYTAWETDEIIGGELVRNIGLALAAVALITLLMLVDVRICFMVLTCVVVTLTNIVGFIHFWKMTIDIVSCVCIVLAIGLCVDYSVHIAHAYLISSGSRLDRAVNSLQTIGPAVLNGGFTTFLALLPLGFATTQIFTTFFKVFLLTVTFGLLHGLVLLPVLLSSLGPVNEDDSLVKNSTNVEKQPVNLIKISSSSNGVHNLAFVQDVSISEDSLDKPI